MPIYIDGVAYVSTVEICTDIGVSRQTLWRWRRLGKIPSGHRYRDGQLVFTESDAQSIRCYANHVEPIQPNVSSHLDLSSTNN